MRAGATYNMHAAHAIHLTALGRDGRDGAQVCLLCSSVYTDARRATLDHPYCSEACLKDHRVPV